MKKAILPILVLAAAFGLSQFLRSTRTEPTKVSQPDLGSLVKTTTVVSGSQHATVSVTR